MCLLCVPRVTRKVNSPASYPDDTPSVAACVGLTSYGGTRGKGGSSRALVSVVTPRHVLGKWKVIHLVRILAETSAYTRGVNLKQTQSLEGARPVTADRECRAAAGSTESLNVG